MGFEARLCALLREVVELYSPSTVVRIAGGWVRDKVRAERGPLAADFACGARLRAPSGQLMFC
jgi:tRNA nucleotidyltransferase/poly(A) polymerase